jgi:hypothetical protein
LFESAKMEVAIMWKVGLTIRVAQVCTATSPNVFRILNISKHLFPATIAAHHTTRPLLRLNPPFFNFTKHHTPRHTP